MRVSKTARVEDSLLTTGFTYRSEDWLKMEMQAFQRLSGLARAVRRPGSAAWISPTPREACLTDSGSAAFPPGMSPQALSLVEEAGGVVTNFKGQPFDVNHKEILATNSAIHPLLQQVIAPEFCLLK